MWGQQQEAMLFVLVLQNDLNSSKASRQKRLRLWHAPGLHASPGRLAGRGHQRALRCVTVLQSVCCKQFSALLLTCGLLTLQVCRLFDLFLATHPLMPLYVGAAAMHSQRQQLLAAEEMPMLHSKLVNLSITKMATADELAIQVHRLAVRMNPSQQLSAAAGHMCWRGDG